MGLGARRRRRPRGSRTRATPDDRRRRGAADQRRGRRCEGFGAGAGTNNGTDIGPGDNGQICADGVCNNPTSYSAPIESLGTKVNTPVMDTPLATKMITHQMLEDQQAITLDQALRNVSGVYVSGGGGAALGVPFTGVVIRGFTTSAYYRDGIRVDNFGGAFTGVGNVELANVQSVEVLKGPAAILYGAVEPGGIVNLNMKQPLDTPAYSIQQQIGSYASYRTTLDATGRCPRTRACSIASPRPMRMTICSKLTATTRT